MYRKFGITAVVFAAAISVTSAAFAGASDYTFEPVTAEVKKGNGVTLAVRLVHKPTGKAVTEPVSAAPKTTTPGSTVGELIALARQLSPELAAAALNAEAAVARITSAGALPDPTGRITTDNLDQRNVSMNGRTTQYRLMQEFPLWGKLDLKRDIASFEATAAQHRRRSAELELVARVKGVFAARYATFQALTLTQQTLDTVTTATANVRDRYSQGSAAQDDVLRLEIEAEELNIEIERLRGQTIKTAAQLNALLNRRPDAPLARPAALRPLPNESKMRIAALVDRAARRGRRHAGRIWRGEENAGDPSAASFAQIRAGGSIKFVGARNGSGRRVQGSRCHPAPARRSA